ncbi:MAG: flavodoxin [Candidatus Omnitrophica bacterium CG11_big_fil_rev_8_21_14_0_20_42_13]|uniref:Flavodoxin n=1 Tax=Candidatus Ghiorseimicrobium undicola TaxID=1974746 RepID=A0A2H0LZI8_9BACT|nr:MAG: flavodoxin [Candidatus Omnitrophica bacterium CG11_big_fil_rev_8_21_14_0_20_42_13]
MPKVLIAYYSRSGTTEKMAKLIARGVSKEGIEPDIRKVADIKAEELLKYDGIVIGSPTYYGTMSYEVKKLFDESVKFHGKLEGKVGGAFSSSANVAGGNETTIMDIIDALLIHGLIVQGDPRGDHYGPVAVGSIDGRAEKECLKFGGRIANLVKKVGEEA